MKQCRQKTEEALRKKVERRLKQGKKKERKKGRRRMLTIVRDSAVRVEQRARDASE